MIIHLDMDGVLVDFAGYWLHLTGKRLNEYPNKQAFWNEADMYPDLYRDLWPMPDASELVDGIRRLIDGTDIQIEVLTAIPSLVKMPNVTTHKEQWIHKHFGYGWKFKTGPYARDKQNHAQPGDVLIDDMIRNINQWRDAGGIGILHTGADETLTELYRILNTTRSAR